MTHILNILIWLPITGGILTLIIDRGEKKQQLAKWFALLVASITFLLSIGLYIGFDIH